MENIKPAVEERKSTKYKSFPDAAPGVWGPEIRDKHPDRLHGAILARIRHVSSRVDQYLPPYDKHYGVDQSLALELENSFDELAKLYLKYSTEGYGKYLYPEMEDGTYPPETIKAFDERLEKIHDLVIKAEDPFFKEKEGKILVDKEGKPIEGTVGDGYKELNKEEKIVLHEKGTSMLKKALDEICKLKTILENKLPLVETKKQIATMQEHGQHILDLAKGLSKEARGFLQRAIERIEDKTGSISFSETVDAVWDQIHNLSEGEKNKLWNFKEARGNNYGEEALHFIETIER